MVTLKRLMLYILLLAPIGEAWGGENGARPVLFTGHFVQDFERQDFYPISGEGPYWVQVADRSVAARIRAIVEVEQGNGAVCLTVKGTLETGGGFGHLGAYSGNLTVEQVWRCGTNRND